MAIRTRVDVWSISLGTVQAAGKDPWHPVLDTYARGVKAMRDLDPQLTPSSWRYAANTHGIDGNTQPRPGIWAQCAHRRRMFLPWHRAYLAWFEQTIRKLTNQPNWALPYWDYSKPTPAKVRTVPPEFRVQTRRVNGATVPNPLFQAGRGTQVPAQDVELVEALGEPRFVKVSPESRFMPVGFGGGDVDGAGGLVEMEPHNFVHGDLGGAMGFPSTAGRDPIFWLHHSNIDRLWEVWRSLAGSIDIRSDNQLPSAIRTEWTSAQFVFGEGPARKRYKIKDCENIGAAPMEYKYDNIKLPASIATAVKAARAAVTPGGPMGLEASEDRFEPVGSSSDITSGDEVDMTLDQPVLGLEAAGDQKLYLELSGVHAENPHEVYLVMVSAGPGAPERQAGRFSTFGLTEVTEDERPTYVVNATGVIPDLLDDGWDGGRLIVRVIADPDRDGADDADRSVQVDQLTVYSTL